MVVYRKSTYRLGGGQIAANFYLVRRLSRPGGIYFLLLFIYLFTCNDSFQTNHLIIYRTDLRQICRVVAVDDRSEIIFFGRLYPQN